MRCSRITFAFGFGWARFVFDVGFGFFRRSLEKPKGARIEKIRELPRGLVRTKQTPVTHVNVQVRKKRRIVDLARLELTSGQQDFFVPLEVELARQSVGVTK